MLRELAQAGDGSQPFKAFKAKQNKTMSELDGDVALRRAVESKCSEVSSSLSYSVILWCVPLF